MMRPIQEQSVDELTSSVYRMLDNVSHVREQTGGQLSKAVKHYVGMNYQLHCDEIERRGRVEQANLYRREWRKVTG